MRCFICLLLALARVLFQEHRGDFSTYLLSNFRVIEGYVYVETRQLAALRTGRRFQWLDFYCGSQPVDKIFDVYTGSVLSVQAEFLNDRLQARPAEDLFFHRGKTVIQVFGDDRLHVVWTNRGLLN